MPRGEQLDKLYIYDHPFCNPELLDLRPDRDTILSVVVAEGAHSEFIHNTLIGRGKVTYESISKFLNGATSLKKGALRLTTSTKVGSRGALEVKVQVDDTSEGLFRYLTEVSMQFVYSGCLPDSIQNALVAEGVREVHVMELAAVKAAVAKERSAVEAAGRHLSLSLQQELETALRGEDVDALWKLITKIREEPTAGYADELYDFGGLEDLYGAEEAGDIDYELWGEVGGAAHLQEDAKKARHG